MLEYLRIAKNVSYFTAGTLRYFFVKTKVKVIHKLRVLSTEGRLALIFGGIFIDDKRLIYTKMFYLLPTVDCSSLLQSHA